MFLQSWTFTVIISLLYSVQSQQSNLKASIAVPQAPFTIGVDAEHSRSVSTTRRAVGKKVVNRTISFRADFEDLPQSITTDPSSAIRDAIPTATYRASVEGSTLTFEERLAKWILEYINHKIEVKSKHKGKLVESSFEMTGNPIDDIASLIHESTNDDVRKMILAACREFVQVFRVTHYVSAIELGASEYQVLCETEYFSQRKAGKIIGVVSLANQAASLSSLWKKTKKASDLKRIGRIDNDRVERGSYDEAVVGVSIQPICNLVRLRYLQLTLKKALLEYVETQGDSTGECICMGLSDCINIVEISLYYSINLRYKKHFAKKCKNKSCRDALPPKNTSPKTNETSDNAHRNACADYPHITSQCIYRVATIPTSFQPHPPQSCICEM